MGDKLHGREGDSPDRRLRSPYFVAETKGALSELQLREIEKAKIACVTKFFVALGQKNVAYHVTYKKVASYADLLTKVNSEND